MKKENNLLTVENILKDFLLYQQAYNEKNVPLVSLAKEMGYKPIRFLEFINENKTHFQTKLVAKNKKQELCLVHVFKKPEENPDNKDIYLEAKKKEFEKTIKLDYYNNYGHISGYYIQVDKDDDLKSKYLNTKEKIERIKDQYALKKASYVIGGYGDSSTIFPENAYEINFLQLNSLLNEGYSIIGEFFDLSKNENQIFNTNKIVKK